MKAADVTAQIGKSLALIEAMLEKLPAPVATSVKTDVAALRQLLFEQRRPRIAIVGPLHTSEATLVNMLLGEDARREDNRADRGEEEWSLWANATDELLVMDARGVPQAALTARIRETAPDIIFDTAVHHSRALALAEIEARIGQVQTQARVQLARLAGVKTVQRSIAAELTAATASVAAGLAAVPIPVADIAPITALQVSLVAGVGYISGRQLTMRSAAEFVAALGANVGAAIVLRHVARAVSKALVPAAGSMVSAGIAWGGTRAVGAAAAAYFIDRQSKQQARERFQVVVKEPPRLPAPVAKVLRRNERDEET